MKYFEVKRSFKKEFRRQIRLAILAAIGFTIAFAWKRAIFDSFQSFVTRFSETYTAIAITLVGVLLIFISSKILRDK